MAEPRELGMLPGGGGQWGCKVQVPPSSRRGLRQDRGRRQPDNDIVISHDLLMELTFIPPTAIDLQFHPGYPRHLESLSYPAPAQQQPYRMQANHTPAPMALGQQQERRATPCLTGRPAHRSYPGAGLSASADSFPGYPSPDLGTALYTSRASFTLGIDAFPRLTREGRKPLQRFAPMLSVPPPQSTAFIEARRRHLRMLMENSSGRPPPNTPEQHASRASSTVLHSQDLLQQAASPVSARSAMSRSGKSRPPTRTSVAVRLSSQRALHNKSPDVKPIVLRMRTRADDSKTPLEDAGMRNSVATEKREGLLPMKHIAPKMLVHQWLEMGKDGQAYSRTLNQPVSRHAERIPLKTQHRCLGDITAKR